MLFWNFENGVNAIVDVENGVNANLEFGGEKRNAN